MSGSEGPRTSDTRGLSFASNNFRDGVAVLFAFGQFSGFTEKSLPTFEVAKGYESLEE